MKTLIFFKLTFTFLYPDLMLINFDLILWTIFNSH